MTRRTILIFMTLLLAASCAGRKDALRPERADQIITHQVQYGETWVSIAEDFYGDESRSGDLAAYNGGDPDQQPEPGSGVRIPLQKADVRKLRSKLDAADVYNEGLDLVSSGDYAGAIEMFRSALELDPGLGEASFNLAVTYQKLGLHERAATVLEDLVTRQPENPEYLFALGNARFHSGDLEGAEEAFLSALEIDPNHLKALFSLAVVYEKRGDLERAANRLAEYIVREPDGEWSAEARDRLQRINEARKERR
jgi:tetratricopeptide (TPR) repeat protein